jgi:hypothetical protein
MSPPPAASPTPFPSPSSSLSPADGSGPASSPARLLLEATSLAVRRMLGGGGAADPCPPGKRHLFPAGTITKAHYLLFFVALVHIIYSLFTFTLTLQRVRDKAPGWSRRPGRVKRSRGGWGRERARRSRGLAEAREGRRGVKKLRRLAAAAGKAEQSGGGR